MSTGGPDGSTIPYEGPFQGIWPYGMNVTAATMTSVATKIAARWVLFIFSPGRLTVFGINGVLGMTVQTVSQHALADFQTVAHEKEPRDACSQECRIGERACHPEPNWELLNDGCRIENEECR